MNSLIFGVIVKSFTTRQRRRHTEVAWRRLLAATNQLYSQSAVKESASSTITSKGSYSCNIGVAWLAQLSLKQIFPPIYLMGVFFWKLISDHHLKTKTENIYLTNVHLHYEDTVAPKLFQTCILETLSQFTKRNEMNAKFGDLMDSADEYKIWLSNNVFTLALKRFR